MCCSSLIACLCFSGLSKFSEFSSFDRQHLPFLLPLLRGTRLLLRHVFPNYPNSWRKSAVFVIDGLQRYMLFSNVRFVVEHMKNVAWWDCAFLREHQWIPGSGMSCQVAVAGKPVSWSKSGVCGWLFWEQQVGPGLVGKDPQKKIPRFGPNFSVARMFCFVLLVGFLGSCTYFTHMLSIAKAF